jgi:hypothetical protein
MGVMIEAQDHGENLTRMSPKVTIMPPFDFRAGLYSSDMAGHS